MTGLRKVITRHPALGRPWMGICGGLQMLGESLVDRHGVDAHGLFEQAALLTPSASSCERQS